jgi:TrmH family RNA methyltransferase
LQGAKGRKSSGCFLIEGEKLCAEALKAGLTIETALVLSGFEGSELAMALCAKAKSAYAVHARVLEAVTETKSPQRALCSARIPGDGQAAYPLVALDGVQDPGNIGAILRSADATGFSALLGPGCADPYAPKAVRAAMGSLFRVRPAQTEDLAAELRRLRAEGAEILVSALDGENFFAHEAPAQRLVLIIGSEGRGVSEEVRAEATSIVRLPMRGGAESLNAAVAAGILMYGLYRGRPTGG